MDKQLMRRGLLLLLCGAPLWATAYTTAAKCSSPCNWSDSSAWSPAGVPGNGDTVSISNTHTMNLDGDRTVGASGAVTYGYVSSVTTSGASGYTSCSTVTFTGGTKIGSNEQGATCAIVGGVPTITLTGPRQFYTVLPTGVTVTASGGSGATYSVVSQAGGGTAAIQLNASGKLVIAGPYTLRVRGDISYTAATANTTDSITGSAGAAIIWDSSQATALADGKRPIYSYGPNTTKGYRKIHFDCPTARCSISSDAAGNVATVSNRGLTWAGGIFLRYTDVTRIGDSITPWLYFYPADEGGNSATSWDIQYDNFVDCGNLYSLANGGGTYNFTFANNTMRGTKATTALWYPGVARTTGSTVISRNVIDVAMFSTTGTPTAVPDYTIEDNIVGNGIWGSGKWASHKRNFVGFTAMGATTYRTNGDVLDSYYFRDEYGPNWHATQAPQDVSATFSGLMFGYGDSLQPGDDSGELVCYTGAQTLTTHYYIDHSIVLPGVAGYGYAVLSCPVSGSFFKVHVTHNTHFSGLPNSGSAFGILDMNESVTNAVGSYQEVSSNIAFNPELTGYVSRPWMIAVSLMTSGINTDVFDPAHTDYNWAWNQTNTQTCVNCTNQGRGYGGKWSVTPGAHEDGLRGDPKFVDWQRTVELFDSKYLGHSYSAWVSGQAYNYGDHVSATDSNTYWGLSVNYRCAKVSGCQGTLKPGVPLTAWRNDGWEWASLDEIRQRMGTSFTTYTLTAALLAAKPSTCDAAAASIVCVMMAWIRAGYAPTNPALRAAGADALDIGAVPGLFVASGIPAPLFW